MDEIETVLRQSESNEPINEICSMIAAKYLTANVKLNATAPHEVFTYIFGSSSGG
jgi:hypothetical protein